MPALDRILRRQGLRAGSANGTLIVPARLMGEDRLRLLDPCRDRTLFRPACFGREAGLRLLGADSHRTLVSPLRFACEDRFRFNGATVTWNGDALHGDGRLSLVF